MNKWLKLKNALTELFQSGATTEHDLVDMEGLLEGINFFALRQVLSDRAEQVYEYRMTNETGLRMEYHGQELFDEPAVLLSVDKMGSSVDVAYCDRCLELWLLPDMTFSVVSCFRLSFHDGDVVTEYRHEEYMDWEETGMQIDFLELAETLESISSGSRS